MKAHDRTLPDWFTRIRTRQLTLPRFQRMEAWDHRSVSELLTTVLRELPAGAALILEVGDSEKFLSRTMVDAPEDGERISEQLLDGQQRLTALWRSLNDSYPDRTFLVGFEADENENGKRKPLALGQSRWWRNGQKYPLWVDDPQGCWERDYVPLHLLYPETSNREIREWVKAAVGDDQERQDDLFDTVLDLQEKVKMFNLPFLALPVSTPRDVALDVFIKMNTSSVKLSTYDIVVALVEEAADESLHDMVDRLVARVPRAADYADVPNLALDVAALLQNRTPNNVGYKGLDFDKLIKNWDALIDGIHHMVQFLEQERIYDAQRLPSYPAIPVIAALWQSLPTQPDALGNGYRLLRQYLWRAFLTSRYDSSTAGNALQDFRGLRNVLRGEAEARAIPIFDEISYPVPSEEEIIRVDWPKRRSILGRGLLALQIKCGAHDIADGAPASIHNVTSREYHHLFPDSRLQKAGLAPEEIYRAANCALITWRTNRTISNKDPINYLKDRVDGNDLGEQDLRSRLATHLIPFDFLAVGPYDSEDPEKLNLEKMREDYDRFLFERTKLLKRAAELAVQGHDIHPSEVFQEPVTGFSP